eukprot:5437714-Amphidinium_carterae.1
MLRGTAEFVSAKIAASAEPVSIEISSVHNALAKIKPNATSILQEQVPRNASPVAPHGSRASHSQMTPPLGG